ncbi:hypothetical protein GGG16DRAFT_67343, partial [Schizophyllum commune]
RQAHHLPHTKILTALGHSLLAVETNRRCYPMAYAVGSTVATVSSRCVDILGDFRNLSLHDRIAGAGDVYMLNSPASCPFQLVLDFHVNPRAHCMARRSLQAYASQLDSINWEFETPAGLNGRAPTTENVIWALGRKNSRKSFILKKLHALAAILVAGETEANNPDFAPDPQVAACMYFLYDCIRATDPQAKYYSTAAVPRPDFLLNPVALSFEHADEKLPGEAKIADARRGNRDMFAKLCNAPRLLADHVATVAARLGLGEFEQGECGPATDVERSFGGRRAQARRRREDAPPPSVSRRTSTCRKTRRLQRRRKTCVPAAEVEEEDCDDEEAQDAVPGSSRSESEDEDNTTTTSLPPRKRVDTRVRPSLSTPTMPPSPASAQGTAPELSPSPTSEAPRWSPLVDPESAHLFSISPDARSIEGLPAGDTQEEGPSSPVLDAPEDEVGELSEAPAASPGPRPTPAQQWRLQHPWPPTPPWERGLC